MRGKPDEDFHDGAPVEMSEAHSQNPPSKDEARRWLRRVRRGIRVTKITCTRCVKGRNGDSFVGFSAAWQSVQDDMGGSGDVHVEEDDAEEQAAQGLNLKDAKLARHMLAMEVDLAALESAVANGTISASYFADATKGVRNNYNELIMREMGLLTDDGDQGK